MKIARIISLLLFAGCLAACSKTSEVDGRIAFTVGFTPDIDVSTKATEVTSSTLSSIYVSATTGSVGVSESEYFTSVSFIKDDGGVFRADKWWPLNDPGFHFFGSNLPLTFSAAGANVAATTETDVVCAYLPNPTFNVPNALTFDHIFAQVGTVAMAAPSPYSISDVTVLITPKVSGTYNIITGYHETDGTGWSGAVNGPETSLSLTESNGLYLIPGSYTMTVSYRLTVGDYTDTFTKNAVVSLVGGKVNNISATVPEGNAELIDVSVTLTPWSDNNINITGP